MARIVESLPACRSTPEEIKSKIQALGARYNRYLHQDEFGPTRDQICSSHHSDWRIVQHHLGSQGNLARNFHQEISGSRPSTQSCVNLVQRIPALVMEFATDTTRIIRLGP